MMFEMVQISRILKSSCLNGSHFKPAVNRQPGYRRGNSQSGDFGYDRIVDDNGDVGRCDIQNPKKKNAKNILNVSEEILKVLLMYRVMCNMGRFEYISMQVRYIGAFRNV